MNLIWLIRLILAHLLTDFVFQKKKWIDDRRQNHFSSAYLYLHTIITTAVALLFMGWHYWYFAIVIFISHTVIDGWKSYRPDNITYFLIDQLLHIIVILGCWCYAFFDWPGIESYLKDIANNYHLWVITTAFLFITVPAGITIEKMTKKWRDDLQDPAGLARAGKWIGILERTIILIFLLQNQYAAIGLLITAKGLIRYNEKEKDSQEQKTEYVLIGSLISVSFSLVTGIIVNYILR